MNIKSETQAKIIDVAKKEFLHKGFKDASLRGIVKAAGFTQGAFYGYYKDKEALFVAIVCEAAEGLIEMFKRAQEAHFELIGQDNTKQSRALSTAYLKNFIAYIYDNFDAFKLVVCCSRGTKYENYIHDLVELEVTVAEQYYARLRDIDRLNGEVSRNLHHMITSAYFTAVFETVVHDMSREEAEKYIEDLSKFFNSGWQALLEFK